MQDVNEGGMLIKININHVFKRVTLSQLKYLHKKIDTLSLS